MILVCKKVVGISLKFTGYEVNTVGLQAF